MLSKREELAAMFLTTQMRIVGDKVYASKTAPEALRQAFFRADMFIAFSDKADASEIELMLERYHTVN